MKKIYIVLCVILISILSMVACSSNQEGKTTSTKEPIKKVNTSRYDVSLVTEPGEVQPNQPVKLVFSVQDYQGQSVNLKDIEIVHEKPMHLIVISEDLSFFNHIHPVPNTAGDVFAVETEFPLPGKYRFYLDYSPKQVGHRLAKLEVNVAGTPPPPVPLVVDKEDSHIVDGVKATIKPEKPFQANEALTLNVLLEDAKTGKPVTDVEPYLGAFAHFNIVNQDHTENLHAHPLKEAESKDDRGGPEVGTRTIFPKPGIYKIWTQFQRNGKVIVVPFIVNVGESKAQTEVVQAESDSGVQKLKVTVSENGFQPTSVQLKAGVPAKITFLRADEKNCGGEVLFTELGIRKDLPLGKEVLVEFTPDQNTNYSFTCGMGMLKGNVVVKN